MAVKMTGAQYKAFLAAEWGPNAMWEETEVLRNGLPVDEDSDSDPEQFKDGDIVMVDVPREHADRFAKMIAENGFNDAFPKVTRV